MIAVQEHRPRVAIIGTGIAGLTCAHRLQRTCALTVFEARDRLGGHTHTVDVEIDGQAWSIDTGFIVFNEPNYPLFTRLLDELGVASHATTMSFSVRCDRSGIEYNGTSIGRLFAQRRNLLRPRFHRMIRDILRFHAEAPGVLERGDERSVRAFLDGRGYSEAFAELYLLPMGSALWSCPLRRFEAFPIRFVVEFMRNHAMLQVNDRPTWRVVTGGSRTYVDAIARPLRDRLRLSTPVASVRRGFDDVVITPRNGPPEHFDEVIFACHADQALRLLEDAAPEEREILGAFPYQRNEVVLHTDTSVLPRRRRAWAAWNYHRRPEETAAATVTYNMNMLQGLGASCTFCVTLNEDDLIDPSKVLRRMTYHHPVFTRPRDVAQAAHGRLIRRRRASFCGAYWGFGFHEDGVRSATAVCEAFERVPV